LVHQSEIQQEKPVEPKQLADLFERRRKSDDALLASMESPEAVTILRDPPDLERFARLLVKHELKSGRPLELEQKYARTVGHLVHEGDRLEIYQMSGVLQAIDWVEHRAYEFPWDFTVDPEAVE